MPPRTWELLALPSKLRDGWVLLFYIPLHPHNLSPGKMPLGNLPQGQDPEIPQAV